jgi:hypothetical protein
MADKVVVVTAPDDVAIDGYRLLVIDLNSIQSKLLSDTLLNISYNNNIILYAWNTGDSVEWLLDKKHKADCIIFNADSDNDIIIGYMAAQKNSHYIGNLKSLSQANPRTIYASEDLKTLINFNLNQYE